MTLSVKHAFQSAKGDGTDASFVQPSNWNAEHTMTLGANTLIGREATGGAAQEIPCTAFGRSLLACANAAAAGALIPSFPATTAMLFAQATAPTGWTKSTTHNDKALRVVSGASGGSAAGTVDFSTAFASKAVNGTVGNTTLTIDQIPAHTHTIGTSAAASTAPGGNTVVAGSNYTTSSVGGGQAHTHSFTGTAIDLAVKYVDVIIATKD